MHSGQGGRGPPRGTWSPLPFRPPSPYAPSPPPRFSSPNTNMFAGRMPLCPRPRWPVPPPGVSPPPPLGKPFRLPMHPPSPAPTRCASPDPYFQGIHPYASRTYSPVTYSPISYSDIGPPKRDYEYVGMPLTPPPLPQNYEVDDEENTGPSTAEIIANQSQDYIDEKLAEYQATIYQLQDKVNEIAPVKVIRTRNKISAFCEECSKTFMNITILESMSENIIKIRMVTYFTLKSIMNLNVKTNKNV